jgi:hypothetical protein
MAKYPNSPFFQIFCSIVTISGKIAIAESDILKLGEIIFSWLEWLK